MTDETNDSKTISLHDACYDNDFNLVNELIKNGININEKDEDMDTPLHIACRENNLKLVKLLIVNGADINDENQYEETPLFIACNKKYKKIIKFLIEYSLNVQDKDEFFKIYSELLWDNGYKEMIKSYHNANEIINLEYLKPYLITKSGSIIDVYNNEFIEPNNNNNSYLQVELGYRKYLVHLLVANTFKPNEDKTLIIKHKNHNILDNNDDNLEWIKYELDLSETEYMCNIEFSEIPEFLHNSELYKSCLESEDDFEILKKYYKNDLIINSIDDFIHMLYTLRFWCIEKIPYEVYDYIITNKIIIEIYYNLLQDIFHDFPFLEEFGILFRYDNESICSNLASRGMIDCLKYAHQNGCPWDKNVCVVASKNGSFRLFKIWS